VAIEHDNDKIIAAQRAGGIVL